MNIAAFFIACGIVFAIYLSGWLYSRFITREPVGGFVEVWFPLFLGFALFGLLLMAGHS